MPNNNRKELKERLLGLPEKREGFYVPRASEVSAQFNVGLADILGLPKVGADLYRKAFGYEEESGFPSSREIQSFMADWGMTYQPGEEPDDIAARFWRNMGASAIPAAKAGRLGMLGAEMLASFGGAVGGKAMEKTTWGERHPMLARAVGELGGGLGLSSTRAIKHLPKLSPLSLIRKPFKGQWAKRRAAKTWRDAMTDPTTRLGGLQVEGLTPTQRLGDRGIARFRKRIEEEFPVEAERGVKQRSVAAKALEKAGISPFTGKIRNTRGYLSNKFKKMSEELNDALENIKAGDERTYNIIAKRKVDEAYSVARNKERDIWGALPEADNTALSNIEDTYRTELSNITEGGDIREINEFARKKLGRLNKKGKLIGGQLLSAKKKKASPKAIHQFYSRLGRKIREVSESGGKANEIRILNNLRKAALQDLDVSDVGDDYREAIRFSKELNEMFTEGGLGKVLGFRRGLATPEGRFLDELLGSGDEKAVENLQQAMRSSPEVKEDAINLIRTRFAIVAKNEKNNIINQQTGKNFVKKYRRVLDLFPDLKTEIQNAITKQTNVDEIAGARVISGMSPYIKQQTAASVFLGSDPGTEIKRVLNYGKSKGQTAQSLKNLVSETKKDTTGKAFKGLQNGFISELMEGSRKTTLEDELTGEMLVSGRNFLKKLNQFAEPLKASGLMSSKEIQRLRKIGQSLKNIEIEFLAKPSKSFLTDRPGVLLDTISAMLGARYGARVGGASPGGQIQSAGIGAKFFRWFSNKITKDEAKDLLIKATHDEETMRDLLTDVRKLNDEQQMTLVQKLVSRAKDFGGRTKAAAEHVQAPAAAVTPPLVSAGKATTEQKERQRERNRLRQKLWMIK